MISELSPQEAKLKWDQVCGIAAEYMEENEVQGRAEIAFTELADDPGRPFLLAHFLDPIKALKPFVGDEEQVYDIDLDNLEQEDPFKVTMNFYFMFTQ